MTHAGSGYPGNTNWYLAFAEWRIERYFAHPRQTVRFFRQSHHHTLIWALVMHGHYKHAPPTFKDCIRTAICAPETTRKIIFDAVAKGYFALDKAPDDRRKKLIRPSRQCIAEYESHVGLFLTLADVLCPGAVEAARRTNLLKSRITPPEVGGASGIEPDFSPNI